jgi:hypothetical protein
MSLKSFYTQLCPHQKGPVAILHRSLGQLELPKSILSPTVTRANRGGSQPFDSDQKGVSDVSGSCRPVETSMKRRGTARRLCRHGLCCNTPGGWKYPID